MRAQKYAPLREDGLAEVGLSYPLIRKMLREIGSRFVQAGMIEQIDDVFWLIEEEVEVSAGKLDAGKIVELGDVFDIFGDPKHPYTQGLLRSVPNIKLDGGELYKMEGIPPNLLRPPSGCRFHPRCPFVMDICRTQQPDFEPVEERDQITACWLYQESSVDQEMSHA